ncbi:sensor histidine kinase [Rhodobacter maris]|nr:HAMP domain-containing sensor histidine kinase [Rhodobacter maris]
MRFAFAMSLVFVLAALVTGGAAFVLQLENMSRWMQIEVEADTRALAQASVIGGAEALARLVAVQVRVGAAEDGRIALFLPDDPCLQPVGNFWIDARFEGLRYFETGVGLVPDAPAMPRTDRLVAYGLAVEGGWLMTGRSTAWIEDQVAIWGASFGWGLGATALITTVVAVFLARRAGRRVARMEHVLEAVGAGNHALRIHDEGGDDLARLAQSVDTALGRLESGIAAIQQVSTDVAHDLRAPLGRLRLRLEPLAQSARIPPEERREIGEAIVDLDHAAITFDAILRLSRMQAGLVHISPRPVDLAVLARDVVDLMIPVAEDLGRVICLEVETAATVGGDDELLGQALFNLIENALRHCPVLARITVGVRRVAGGAEVSVCDDGPGVPEADLGRICERFVRLDTARSTPGSGIGLSLVRAIADLHTARFTLENGAPGLCARIVFPRAECV